MEWVRMNRDVWKGVFSENSKSDLEVIIDLSERDGEVYVIDFGTRVFQSEGPKSPDNNW